MLMIAASSILQPDAIQTGSSYETTALDSLADRGSGRLRRLRAATALYKENDMKTKAFWAVLGLLLSPENRSSVA